MSNLRPVPFTTSAYSVQLQQIQELERDWFSQARIKGGIARELKRRVKEFLKEKRAGQSSTMALSRIPTSTESLDMPRVQTSTSLRLAPLNPPICQRNFALPNARLTVCELLLLLSSLTQSKQFPHPSGRTRVPPPILIDQYP